MFSGIVEEVGVVAAPGTGGGAHTTGSTAPGRLRITAGEVADEAGVGDSIAVNGCCLTVAATEAGILSFDVMPETARRTTIGHLRMGDQVNLESALEVGERLGGHLVTGHVDAVGTVAEVRDEEGARRLCVRAPAPVLRLLAPQGAVAVDGISLTVVDVDDSSFTVSLVAHTLSATTAGGWTGATAVNLEADLVARYVARALELRGEGG